MRPLIPAVLIALACTAAGCSATQKVMSIGDKSYTGMGSMGTGSIGNSEGQGGPSAGGTGSPKATDP